jgi:transcriptional regulator with XRE-family HTH domain
VADFDLAGVLRRIRRRADLSQRDLAKACGVAASVIAHAEAGRRGVPVDLLVRAAGVAGLRLALLDGQGQEVGGMSAAGVRDRGDRRFPAHLDVRHADLGWWAEFDRYTLVRPDFTFDRKRYRRDWMRQDFGTPPDHLVLPDDDPQARRARRREAGRRREREEYQRRLAEGRVLPPVGEWVCSCPPLCDELDDRSGKPVHADDCPCGCDVG